MSRRWLLGGLLLCTLAGCDQRSIDSLQASEVLRIKLCPEDGDNDCAAKSDRECYAVADGATPVRVSICTPVTGPRPSMFSVTSTLTAGHWQAPPAGTAQAAMFSLSVNPFVDLQLVADRKPLPIEIAAIFGGFHTSAQLQVTAAPLEAIEFSAQPIVLSATSSTMVTLNTRIRARGPGAPTEGTLVRFEVVEVQPSGVAAEVIPERRVIGFDEQSGATASTQLYVASKATSVTVRATALPPTIEGAPNTPAALTQNLKLVVAQ